MSRPHIDIMTDLAALMLAFVKRGDIADDDLAHFEGRSTTVGELLEEADQAIGDHQKGLSNAH